MKQLGRFLAAAAAGVLVGWLLAGWFGPGRTVREAAAWGHRVVSTKLDALAKLLHNPPADLADATVVQAWQTQLKARATQEQSGMISPFVLLEVLEPDYKVAWGSLEMSVNATPRHVDKVLALPADQRTAQLAALANELDALHQLLVDASKGRGKVNAQQLDYRLRRLDVLIYLSDPLTELDKVKLIPDY